jgi:hypothetical protein
MDSTPKTPTTPFSPAAQSIAKAFDDRYELLGPLEDDWQEQCLAAAIRAAADQLRIDMTATACINHLYRIAAELELYP